MTKQSQDYEYFLQNMDKFYEHYGHKFLAIKDQQVLAAYESFDLAIKTTLKTEELGTFLIQECLDDKNKLIHHFQGNVMPVSA